MTAAVIAGIGATEFTKASGRKERELAIEAVRAAIADAGLTAGDIDGLVTYDADINDPLMLSEEMALGNLGWYSCTPYGGGGPGAVVQDAMLAVESGLARTVVCYRAANLRSGRRFGQGAALAPHLQQLFDWSRRAGLFTPAQMDGLTMHRYLHDRGLTNADLAPVVVSARAYARTNPNAHYHGRDFTADDHAASRWVVEPVLRVADCCQETDGGVALIVTGRDRARDGNGAVAIRAAARALAKGSRINQNHYSDDIAGIPDFRWMLDQLWSRSGIGPGEIDAAIIYDAFSPLVMMALEALGLPRGRALADFIAAGGIGPNGDLPVNMNGGQLGEAYVHGFNGMIEAVRQLRGTAANQVADIEHLLVTGSPALVTSGLILSPV